MQPPPKGMRRKPRITVPRIPALCTLKISRRDPKPMCIACIAIKNTQASLTDLPSCPYCNTMPEKILVRRLRVAVASSPDPCLPTVSEQCATTSHSPQTAQRSLPICLHSAQDTTLTCLMRTMTLFVSMLPSDELATCPLCLITAGIGCSRPCDFERNRRLQLGTDVFYFSRSSLSLEPDKELRAK